MGFCFWDSINHAAIAAAMFPMGLSFFYLAICITVWTCQSWIVAFLFALAPNMIGTDFNVNIIHIMAIGTAMELLCIIFSTLGLVGATRKNTCLLVTWAVYLPIYILYQIAVIVMMIRVAAEAAAGGPSGANPYASYLGYNTLFGLTTVYRGYLVFIPVIIFWGIQILINIFGEAITIVSCRSFSDISDDAFKHR